jgi:hypothetical protein
MIRQPIDKEKTEPQLDENNVRIRLFTQAITAQLKESISLEDWIKSLTIRKTNWGINGTTNNS